MFRVLPIRVLTDNYSYLIMDLTTKQVAVVDPVDPLMIKKVLDHEQASVSMILTTHHHWDHASGNNKMKELYPHVSVYGNDQRIQGLTHPATTPFQLGSLSITPIQTPCHTLGHVCYFVESSDGKEKAVFTGDTLFVGGCGRFFEGTADQMYEALIQKLGKLPKETLVYCGHEYTKKNLEFAMTVDPQNLVLKKKYEWAKQVNQTVPSTIEEELLTNPFMRVHEISIQQHLNTSNPLETMATLRNLKDNY